MSNYESALAYINTLINSERSPDFSRHARHYNLERISRLLNLLGNPHRRLKVIHVAGSKGKGSTAAITASILTHAGYKTGLFSQPHLITPRERCRIDFQLISEVDFAHYVGQLKPAIKTITEMESIGRVSFFELYTGLAFCYFAAYAVDFAVIEVGLGGRLDATNVVNPMVSVITPISLEHTAILGNTHHAIAQEKAGIIKSGCPVVLSPQPPEARCVFETVAADRHAPVVQVEEEMILDRDWDTTGQRFNFEATNQCYRNLFLPLLGKHQTVNAATAIACIERIKALGYCIPTPSVYDGLSQLRWQGRIQIVDRAPFIVLDGAHSPASAKALSDTIREVFRYERFILVVGLMNDKDVQGIGSVLCRLADAIITTQAPDNPRAMPADEIAKSWSDLGAQPNVCPNVSEALRLAQLIAGTSDLICVTGSMILVGEAMKTLGIELSEI